MTAQELRLACIVAGIGAPTYIAAARYAQPTRAWLAGPFYDYFRRQLWSVQLHKWTVPWECRDFARAFACFAQVCNALTPDRNPAADALAVGELWYHPGGDRNAGHAINIAFVDDTPLYIEPQTGQCVTLSNEELASSYFCRF